MATTIHSIEVPMPAGAHASPEDIEMLQGLFRAIAAIRFDVGRDWSRTRRALESCGWSVTWGLQWHVEARRGRELEQACGLTLDEAFATLHQAAGEQEPLEGAP